MGRDKLGQFDARVKYIYVIDSTVQKFDFIFSSSVVVFLAGNTTQVLLGGVWETINKRWLKYLIRVFWSQFILSYNLVSRQIEDIESVRTRLNRRISNADRSSVENPQSVALVGVDSEIKSFKI